MLLLNIHICYTKYTDGGEVGEKIAVHQKIPVKIIPSTKYLVKLLHYMSRANVVLVINQLLFLVREG